MTAPRETGFRPLEALSFERMPVEPGSLRRGLAAPCFSVCCPALSIIFTVRAGNGLLWIVPLLHWGVDKLDERENAAQVSPCGVKASGLSAFANPRGLLPESVIRAEKLCRGSPCTMSACSHFTGGVSMPELQPIAFCRCIRCRSAELLG